MTPNNNNDNDMTTEESTGSFKKVRGGTKEEDSCCCSLVPQEPSRPHEQVVVLGASEYFPLMSLDDHNALRTVLKFLPYNDLNNVAVASRRLWSLRSSSDPSLDQTRSATLDFTNNNIRGGNSFTRFEDAIEKHNLKEVLSGNRTALHLVGYIEGFDDSSTATTSSSTPSDDPTSTNRSLHSLPNVTILDLSHSKRPKNPYVEPYEANFLSGIGQILPNVKTLDLSGAKDDFVSVREVYLAFPELSSLIARDSQVDVFYHGSTLRLFKNLREIYAPGQSLGLKPQLQFGLPPQIERLDIRFVRTDCGGVRLEEDELRTILRYCPSLQWLRCDGHPQYWRVSKSSTAPKFSLSTFDLIYYVAPGNWGRRETYLHSETNLHSRLLVLLEAPAFCWGTYFDFGGAPTILYLYRVRIEFEWNRNQMNRSKIDRHRLFLLGSGATAKRIISALLTIWIRILHR